MPHDSSLSSPLPGALADVLPSHAPMHQFSVAHGELQVGALPLTQLAARVGQTPFYAYDRALLWERMDELRGALPRSIRLHYALKANPLPALAAFMSRLVDGMDVASGGELKVALDAGVDPQHISFAGPGKRDSELRQAVAAGVLVHIESEREVEILERHCNDLGLGARVAVRVNPDFELKGSGLKMGGGSKPFGVDVERVPLLLSHLRQAGLGFEGFHLFAGSQNLQASAICQAQQQSYALALRLAEHAHEPVRTLNLGGGFGIPYFAGEERLQLKPIGDNLAQLATQQTASARASLQRALTLDANYYPAIAALAGMDLADKKPAEARQRIEALLSRQPKHPQALLALADIAARSGASLAEVTRLLSNAVAANPALPEPRMMLIEAYLGSKDYKNATSAAQAAVAALPDEPRLVDALGRSLQADGDTNQALTSYRRLATLMPQSPLPYWRQADVQLLMKDREGAIQSLQKALTMQSNFLEAQRALVALYMTDKRPEPALEVARTVQKQRPSEDTGYLMEADIQASGKNWDKAVTALRGGMKQISTTPMAMKLHTSLLAAGKGTEATQFSAQWLKDHPQDAAFVFYLGDQAMARQDFAGAEPYLAAALKMQPDNPLLLNNLAWVNGKLKKDGAVALAERAVALAPKQPTYLDTLASLHSELGHYPQALELQTRALALQPQNPMLKLNLAIIHLRAGKKDLAKQSLDELSALGGGFSGQAQVQAMQKELTKP